ncbi:MAG: hypothetical protein Q7K16_04705 [Candidatus Azambacteria bacterium]|nr:hypothetical protein [Candidatus Azambacteria bacterium]
METVNFEGQSNNEPRQGGARNKKLIWGGVILAVLILAVAGWQYWQYTNSSYYQQMKAVKAFEKLYEDDKIGGKTPEETLAMFLDAVKKEDFELASQYAVYGSRESVKEWLTGAKNNNQLEELISAYLQAKKEKGGIYEFDFNIYENGRVVSRISVDKNSQGIWKVIR